MLQAAYCIPLELLQAALLALIFTRELIQVVMTLSAFIVPKVASIELEILTQLTLHDLAFKFVVRAVQQL